MRGFSVLGASALAYGWEIPWVGRAVVKDAFCWPPFDCAQDRL